MTLCSIISLLVAYCAGVVAGVAILDFKVSRKYRQRLHRLRAASSGSSREATWLTRTRAAP